ncbi:VCBS repeat protein [Marinoscillum furvescens DSM 4134]|uniref:VCBS repeat protein n=2 Tax=Marinoscillum furvescens TaxID=1026 RepID=A0A3D9L258_MARFU|nr:VCBS repeat protein [Marinoscillum furvescens DSM 4134]
MILALWLSLSMASVKAQQFVRMEHAAGLSGAVDANGAAVADYDLDGDLDVFLVARQDNNDGSGTQYSRLYQNNNDGSFTEVAQQLGIQSVHDYTGVELTDDIGLKLGASWGDMDNDGYPDLLLTSIHHVQLYRNTGGGFNLITRQSGLPHQDSCNYSGAVWWDYDRDGYLDIYLTKWGGCTSNKLYKNSGSRTFTEVTELANIADPTPNDPSWMAVSLDVNKDDWPDLYVANDFGEPNRLYLNQMDGTFKEVADSWNAADRSGDGMGIATGDPNADGWPDMYITNIGESAMLRNDEGKYTNVSVDWGVLKSGWAWGTAFTDWDHDMDEDLMVVNGYGQALENFYYQNQSNTDSLFFKNLTDSVGLSDPGDANGLATFDYDNDGDLDLLVTNSNESVHLYENHTTGNWLSVELVGSSSNRSAFGARLIVSVDRQRMYRYHHGSSFLAQNQLPIHFGLGDHQLIDRLIVVWPSGIRQVFQNLPANKHLKMVEGKVWEERALGAKKRMGCTDLMACNYNPNATGNDGSCEYLKTGELVGPALSANLRTDVYTYTESNGGDYEWEVSGGRIISDKHGQKITVEWGVGSEGEVSVRELSSCASRRVVKKVSLVPRQENSEYSIARLWNELLLEAIRNDYARPTVHARNLFHLSVAMYDAWAVFDQSAQTYLLGNTIGKVYSPFQGFRSEVAADEAREAAISYAAYRLLKHRFEHSPKADITLPALDQMMKRLSYDQSFLSTDYTTGNPAALGNYIAEAVIKLGEQDGAREATGYDNAHYKPVNNPLYPEEPSNPDLADPNRWQPLSLREFIDQAGNPTRESSPEFLSPEWGSVVPFALNQQDVRTAVRKGHEYFIHHDPGAPPYLDTTTASPESKLYQWNFVLVARWSAELAPTDGVLWDISPGAMGNIAFEDLPRELSDHPGFYDSQRKFGTGHQVNPATGSAYEPQLVPRGDFTRVLAEFWADGPDSETPPGHWFVLLNHVSDHPDLEKRLEGTGPLLSDLEWDIKAYFLLGGAMHDAAVSAWSIKGWYDYIRPVSAIRYMAAKGQSSDPGLPNYHVAGLPLVDGLIEMVTKNDSLAGANQEHIGKLKLYAWKGHRYIDNTETDQAGVGWILAENWWPYQRPSFVTPPFAGYVSGHSTFSRAAAELLTRLTGSSYFPGGMGEFVAHKNEFLVFEEGPSQDVVLQWATYQDASDQCSLSRIWGGIHPPADDIPGRIIGEKIGKKAFSFGTSFFSGKVLNAPVNSVDIYPNPVLADRQVVIRGSSEGPVYLAGLDGKSWKLTPQYIDEGMLVQLPPVKSGVYVMLFDGHSFKVVIPR